MISFFDQYFVRLGPAGALGRFVSIGSAKYQRGSRVICRTARGLEIGEVTSPIEDAAVLSQDGTILRGMSPEDDFIWQRLTERRDEAFEVCRRLLRARDRNALLIDAEILFDAKNIFFYFLGNPPQDLESMMQELGSQFEVEIRFAEFAEAVEIGCGPGCGTDEAAGCGDSCSTCSVVQACKKH
jgi:cell fate regulator YaaT (PSP1 superfamily)